MPKLKLTYFDFHGGRGEPARLALSVGGIAFEDDRVSFADWERRKADTPFGSLPVLEVDGQTLAQSNAINRYVGRLVDLYPSDLWAAALELSLKVGDGGNREGGISWGCLTPPLLHRRSDMPCPKITSSS
ncbi:hypothetical protein KHC23_13780 [Ancylobacter dichloromethanicus]|uniref:GST N-terminal domain-containing protein n=1 Tax=Ancylobacter dichloromethanicus TaxID=518825 RepID=A0A9W6MZU5_9HYPH|nr:MULTISPECIES: glutathione S-transferase N-terminal domain-containing protein [Hyphomicrobiales]MBS7554721.1 hypothetical protein [Ancylobacter dichloromethanicus]GLK72327.1 hypothetical protein GCM10017643_24430 [Ancylobacter dichloromethanicus]